MPHHITAPRLPKIRRPEPRAADTTETQNLSPVTPWGKEWKAFHTGSEFVSSFEVEHLLPKQTPPVPPQGMSSVSSIDPAWEHIFVFAPKLCPFAGRNLWSIQHPRQPHLVWNKKLLPSTTTGSVTANVDFLRWQTLGKVHEEMCQSELVVQNRNLIFYSNDFQNICKRWWTAVNHNIDQTILWESRITKMAYCYVQTRLYIELVGVSEMASGVDAFQSDYEIDSSGEGGLSFKQFCVCLFEIVDTWTSSITVEEYCALAADLLVRVFVDDPLYELDEEAVALQKIVILTEQGQKRKVENWEQEKARRDRQRANRKMVTARRYSARSRRRSKKAFAGLLKRGRAGLYKNDCPMEVNQMLKGIKISSKEPADVEPFGSSEQIISFATSGPVPKSIRDGPRRRMSGIPKKDPKRTQSLAVPQIGPSPGKKRERTGSAFSFSSVKRGSCFAEITPDGWGQDEDRRLSAWSVNGRAASVLSLHGIHKNDSNSEAASIVPQPVEVSTHRVVKKLIPKPPPSGGGELRGCWRPPRHIKSGIVGVQTSELSLPRQVSSAAQIGHIGNHILKNKNKYVTVATITSQYDEHNEGYSNAICAACG